MSAWIKSFCFFAILSTSVASMASPGKHFDRVIFIIFENAKYDKAIQQPYFSELAKSGAHFSNFSAVAHPSQGNYIALTSGSLNGIKNDKSIDLDVLNVADLLEAKSLTWKVYAENYPGNCFKGESSGIYVRKHNPFISYKNISSDKNRCANIVSASQFTADADSGSLPEYVFFVPNTKDDGHDTGPTKADKWFKDQFSQYFSNEAFMKRAAVVITFDEDEKTVQNHVYTTIIGADIVAGDYTQSLNHYSLLKLVEENWSLGDLGKDDSTSPSIPNIWKKTK